MSANYSILKQSAQQLREVDNSPSVSMWPHLVNSAQTKLINAISIYTEPGKTSDEARLLYLNETALAVWNEMKRATEIVGVANRPPKTAVLSFGMPFSE